MIPIRLPWRPRARPSATLHEIPACSIKSKLGFRYYNRPFGLSSGIYTAPTPPAYTAKTPSARRKNQRFNHMGALGSTKGKHRFVRGNNTFNSARRKAYKDSFGALGVSSVNRRSTTVLIPLLVFVALDAELDQTVNQLGIRYSGRAPQLRVHADRGKAWHGIDFVDVDPARLGIH